MQNTEFTIPTFGVLREVRSGVESIGDIEADTAEVAFRSCVDVEKYVSGIRAVAVETASSERRGVISRIVSPTRMDESTFVERESVIGGALFTRDNNVSSQRFWCYDNDWFFEKTERTEAGYLQTVIRYQVADDRICKLIGGKEYPIYTNELKTLSLAVAEYGEAVKNVYVNEKLI